MKLLLARHLWGVPTSYSQALPQFKEQGYDAIETGLLYLAEPKETFFTLLNKLDFKWIPMIFTQGRSVEEHITSFTTQIQAVMPYQPLLINSHSGLDSFTESEAIHFFHEALKIEKDFGIPISHETHRGRIFYNPWTTRNLLLKFPDLKICCDYSHWVTVCERLLDHEEEILQLCAERCVHIHARVGFEQGPQVPDPRAPEYQNHLIAHERWWDMIWKAQKKMGASHSTLTPEFGPAPYMTMVPYLQKPIADLDAICLWQMQRQKANFIDKNY